jgi:hypothetical protein
LQYFPGRSDDGYRVPFTKVVYLEVRWLRHPDAACVQRLLLTARLTRELPADGLPGKHGMFGSHGHLHLLGNARPMQT